MAYFQPSKADYLTPYKHLSWERGYQHGAEDLTITHMSYTQFRHPTSLHRYLKSRL